MAYLFGSFIGNRIAALATRGDILAFNGLDVLAIATGVGLAWIILNSLHRV